MSVRRHGRQCGMTLIELIVFVVIVGVALAGVMSVFNISARTSADPLVRKQMLAIAEGLLEEVMLRPFTWCDTDDPLAATAINAAACATPEATGPEPGETRVGGTPFDNVNDYAGLALPSPIPSVTGTSQAPAGYSATIAVIPEALNGVGNATPASATLRIAVTVTFGTESILLEGYRARYAPNFLP